MPERRPSHSETAPQRERESRPHYDLSTIMGINVDSVKIPEEITQMAGTYLQQLAKEGANQAQLAELAYAFRRQLQTDLSAIKDESQKEYNPKKDELQTETKGSLTKRLRTKLLKTDETHAFSLAIYRKLLESASDTIQKELARHEKEHKEINGNHETYKGLRRNFDELRIKHHALLAEIFKRSGQETSPFHLVKRATLEASMADAKIKLEALKAKNPDIAALVEYDTVNEYATQLRKEGFVWTQSRQKLLDDILKASLTNRPIVALMGETGAGKTAIVRAASKLLSFREPERAVGGNQEKFARLLASPAILEGKTYYEYGPILRAMTGKTSSIDTNSSGEGHIFFDDEFNTRPTSVQREIQKFMSEARAGRQISIPGTPLTETVQPGFLAFLAGNPPSERYDRQETGIETKREFAGNVLNVEYLEQSNENPELYQILIASLMDQKTGRLTVVSPEEVAPHFQKPDAITGESHLDTNPTSGAFLWRFASAWGELFKAFSYKDTVLHAKNPGKSKADYHLPTFILDPGVVLTWLDRYKASPNDRKEHIATFLLDNLSKYLAQFPEEEQRTVEAYMNHFGIAFHTPVGSSVVSERLRAISSQEHKKPAHQVLTPKEIGYLNPNVPRPIEKRNIPPIDTLSPLLDENGDTVGQYIRVAVLGVEPNTDLVRRGDVLDTDAPKQITLLGVGYNETDKTMDTNIIHVRANDGTLLQYDLKTFRKLFIPEITKNPDITSEVGELAPFKYDKAKAREYGFSEMSIEAHPKAQAIVDAIYARDPRFVSVYKVGDNDPDNSSKILNTEKIKLNEAMLKTAWNKDCSTLPNVPEKSIWYFERIAEHRLSYTVDGDDKNNLNNPTIPLVPGFGQKSFMLAMDFNEFDHNNTTDKQNALTPQTKKILQTLFNTEDPTNISRDQVNKALWSDHEVRAQSDKAKQVILELLPQGENTDDYELRLMRPDEYERSADAKGYGKKNLWTHMEGYTAHDDGLRCGLSGGARDHGGAANVGSDHRDRRNQNIAVRLVLSRK